MDDLLIPMGINDAGVLVDPKSAKKGESYYCPACHSQLILRQGSKKVFHFAHKADCDCNQETVIHRTAKKLIRQVVEEWKGGGKPPRMQRSCYLCSSNIEQSLPEKVEHAEEELRVGNYIADIALMGKGVPMAAIEIKVTHAVDEVKERDMPIPFIELDGEEVIGNPFIWRPLIDKFNPVTCKECKDNQKKIVDVAKQTKVTFTWDYYRPAIIDCYRCKKNILVFSWPKHGIFPKEKPVKEPRPRTIQSRYSNTLKSKYWANTCPHCGAIQGDFFLFNVADGPFFREPSDYEESGVHMVSGKNGEIIDRFIDTMLGGL